MAVQMPRAQAFNESPVPSVAFIRSSNLDDQTYVKVIKLNPDWTRFDFCQPTHTCSTLGDYRNEKLKDRNAQLLVIGYGLYTAQAVALTIGFVTGLGYFTSLGTAATRATNIFNTLMGTGVALVGKVIFFFTGTAVSGSAVIGLVTVSLGTYLVVFKSIDGSRRLQMAQTITSEIVQGHGEIRIQGSIIDFVGHLRGALAGVRNDEPANFLQQPPRVWSDPMTGWTLDMSDPN